ncbi:MAG: hypothetical protein NZ853_00940 [Leptospiraceae bacterium]|nr:hypothetical protein [Leptospiraceae bacterium]MDW7976205.1 hypothetical protein [Leptospiraceae bacterium]
MYYFDSLKHNFVEVGKTIEFPSVSLINFDIEEAFQIYQILVENFPNFDQNFQVVNQEFILGQKKYYAFLKIEPFYDEYLGLELRILASYSGGATNDEILKNATQNYSPSFRTNKIYYQLFLFCFIDYKILRMKGYSLITEIRSKNLDIVKNYVIPDTEQRYERWIVSLFDEVDLSDLTKKFEMKIPYEWKAKIWKKPFTIERATLALNLVSIQQFNFIKEDFYFFVKDLYKKEKFESIAFQEYFTNWAFVQTTSRSGNIQWKFTKIPFLSL